MTHEKKELKIKSTTEVWDIQWKIAPININHSNQNTTIPERERVTKNLEFVIVIIWFFLDEKKKYYSYKTRPSKNRTATTIDFVSIAIQHGAPSITKTTRHVTLRADRCVFVKLCSLLHRFGYFWMCRRKISMLFAFSVILL